MRFYYKAKNLQGDIQEGYLEAQDTKELAKILKNKGFFVVDFREVGEKSGFDIKSSRGLPISFGVPLKEKILFLRNLKVMLDSGISLPEALQKISGYVKNKKLKLAISDIKEKVVKGKKLSEAISYHKDIFPNLYYTMIKAGEESGNLGNALESILIQTEREYELTSNIKGAMIYPAVIIMTMIGIGVIMLVFVVPSLSNMFESLGVELPQTTKAIIFIGDLFLSYWYLFVIMLGVLAFFAKKTLFSSAKEGKGPLVSKMLLRIPLVSNLMKSILVARFVRMLAILLKSGVSLVESLEIIKDTLDNYYYKKAIEDAKEKVQKGIKLSEALQPYYNLFIPPTIELIAVGEDTGKTSDILSNLSIFMEEEIKRSTKNIISAIEPMIMVLIGGVIGFFAVAMIQPMMSLMSAI
ncbi:Type II secretion system protein F [bacterium HR34]|nr:Type II secretion system protein F [bacterium HR34]